MSVGEPQPVRHDLVPLTKTILIGTRQPSDYELVFAYRILSLERPRWYGMRLARALVRLAYPKGRQVPVEHRLELVTEAVAAVRDGDSADPFYPALRMGVLAHYHSLLAELDRLADEPGLEGEITELARRVLADERVGGNRLHRWASDLARQHWHPERLADLTEVLDELGVR